MIEIFKTNICTVEDASHLQRIIQKRFRNCMVNFDLDDCDKIMRVEGEDISVNEILELSMSSGLKCEIL